MPSLVVSPHDAPVVAPRPGFMTLTIVGSGASTGVPVIGHMGTDCACHSAITRPDSPDRRSNVSLLLTLPKPQTAEEAEAFQQRKAAEKKESEERSGKPVNHASFAMAVENAIGDTPVHFLLIDCGKTFRDAYFRVLVQHGVQLVDALFLTHDHADAMAGLDDLRDLQNMHMLPGGDWLIDNFIPTYLHGTTLDTLKKRVGYIVGNSQEVGPAPKSQQAHEALMDAHVARLKAEKGEDRWNAIGIRRSTSLQFFTLPDDAVVPFYTPALCAATTGKPETSEQEEEEGPIPMYALPVEHGKNYISLGFVFGRGTAFKSDLNLAEATTAEAQVAAFAAEKKRLESRSCVVYISDVSEVPPASMAFLTSLVKIDVLIVDCLYPPGEHITTVHYGMDEAVELVAVLKPTNAYGVGMYCTYTHEQGQLMLRDKMAELVVAGRLTEGEVEGFELGYDGLELTLPQ